MSRQAGERSRSGNQILPENPIRCKPLEEHRSSFAVTPRRALPAGPEKGPIMTLVANQFQDAVADLRTEDEAIELAVELWRAWGEGRLSDADAEAASSAIAARRTAISGSAAGTVPPGAEARQRGSWRPETHARPAQGKDVRPRSPARSRWGDGAAPRRGRSPPVGGGDHLIDLWDQIRTAKSVKRAPHGREKSARRSQEASASSTSGSAASAPNRSTRPSSR